MTISSLLTAGGIATAGTIVFIVVELIKRVFPAIDDRVSGALQATVILAVLYAWAYAATPGTAVFTAVVYFLTADATAVGINSGLDHVNTQLAARKPS